MTTVGQIEKRTQARVVVLFREWLCYDHHGDKNRALKQGMMRELLTGRIRLG